ncbi:MAG: DEAD/DEAH box helicase [Chthoniobacter sp.]|uniref:DEAD/DEAH box helicase n=1 Tax=Chthoniobacter sp. TaxID=2510640 RepID=UPI0032A4BE68
MRGLPAAMQQRGEDYFARGMVRRVRDIPGENGFQAEVQGTETYLTEVIFDPSESAWYGLCSCPVEEDCKHAYALMRTVLSDGTKSSPPTAKAAPKGKKPPLEGFAAKLATALGRDLMATEAAFVARLETLFAQARTRGSLQRNDLVALGLADAGDGSERLDVWPSLPEDVHDFWLHIVCYLQEQGSAVPDFMVPLSDAGPLAERLEKWRRGRTVDRWKRLLANLQAPVRPAPTDLGDLRLRFESDGAVVEWRRAGGEEFEPIRPAKFAELGTALLPADFAPEAALLYALLAARAKLGAGPKLLYVETGAASLIDQLARLPWLANRLVDKEGRPLARPAEPLRWQLAPAPDAHEDYRLQLVQPDGAPAGECPLVLTGQPTLYLTAHALWDGPPVDVHALNPSAETRIPAPALESVDGARFLHSLDLDLPPALRDRVRIVRLRPRLRCELQPTYAGAKTEICVIEVLGESSEGGAVLHYTPHGWMSRSDPMAPSAPEGEVDGRLIGHDDSLLQAVPSLLEALAPKWDSLDRHWFVKVSRKFTDTFVPWLRSLPRNEIEVELRGALASFLDAPLAGSLRLDVQSSDVDWFDLRVVLEVTDLELTPEEIKALLDAGGKWVRLGAKGWRRLEFQLSAEDEEELSRLGLNPREFSSAPQRLHALQLADKAAARFLPEAQYEAVVRRVAELQARVTPDVPAGIQAELRPYQREGFHFLAYLTANRFGGILADDMGLGKTLQTLTWLLWLRAQPEGARPSLVVCPKSVTDNWRAEVEHFAPGLRVRVWPSGGVENFPAEIKSADLHVINYAQLRSIGDALAKKEFLAVILDEGQFIKNPTSITARLAIGLRAAHRLVLTGTPIENRLLDLWSLMAFAMPGALGPRAEFARLYDAKDDPHARRRLSARVRPFVLRRTKSQVAKDLPDRIEEDLFCELEGEQKTLYRAELKRAQLLLMGVHTPQELAKNRFHVLTSLLRLRQICCDPRLIKPASKSVGAKLEALVDQLEPLMEEGQKVLVFSQFVEMLGLIRTTLAERGWPIFYLAGDTENRGELVRNFQSAPGSAIFLISLKAGGFGLNLTAASYVVLFDPWWNPAVENQAIDRTHRIGQVNKVIAYRLLVKDSVEGKIRALQKTKRALADDVLGEEQFAQSLTLDELRSVFAD